MASAWAEWQQSIGRQVWPFLLKTALGFRFLPIGSFLSSQSIHWMGLQKGFSMNIRALDSACLLVRDVERSRKFYSQALGMEEIPRPRNFNFPGAWLKKGSAILHLVGEAKLGRVDQVAGRYNQEELADGYGNHIAFEVEDIDEAVQALKTCKVEIVGGPRPRGDGITQLYICDPDGYIIELCDGQK